MLKLVITLFVSCVVMHNLQAQYIGIGTADPTRALEIEGTSEIFACVRTSGIGSESGIIFTRGADNQPHLDWGLFNDASTFKLFRSADNFQLREEVMRFNTNGFLGLGITTPATPLHVAGGTSASNTLDGTLVIGDKNGVNMVASNNRILVRSNGSAYTLSLQPYGGDLVLQASGGLAIMGSDDNDVHIGTDYSTAKVNIEDAGLQILLENGEDGSANNWYIGATADNWNVGDDHLIFTPQLTSVSAPLRLKNTPDNNGLTAPVEIKAGTGQKLLLDGNEIDSRDGTLYINYNSGFNTVMNAQGGNVGIGTDDPDAKLHVASPGPGPAIWIRQGDSFSWTLETFLSGDLGFKRSGVHLASVDETSGNWIQLSDARAKSNVRPLESVLDALSELEVYSYSFDEDSRAERNIGLMAQEIREVFPELVVEDEGDLSMSYSQLAVIALRALQEQAVQIEKLKSRLYELVKEDNHIK